MPVSIPRRYLLALTTSAVLGVVIIPSRGHYRADSMIYVFVALALVIALVVDLWRPSTKHVNDDTARMGLVTVLSFFLLTRVVDSRIVANPQSSIVPLKVLSAVQIPIVITYLFDRKLPVGSRMPLLRFAFLGLTVLALGLLVYRIVPAPTIDVWTVQMEGARALLDGKNPFEVVAMHDTAPGVERDDVPYVYPPLQLLLTLPSFLLGDVRYTMIVALVAAGFVLRAIARRAGKELEPIVTDAPALALWFSPKVPFVLEQSWIDPVQVALIVIAAAFALAGKRWAAAIAFGLVLAAKQTMFWVAPLALVAFTGFGIRHMLVAGVVAALPHAVFAAWNARALYHANFAFVSGLPARPDALSIVNWAHRAFGITVPYSIAFPLAAVIVALVVWRRRREPESFGIALTATYFFFFLFNKWTFANYYFTLMGLAALGGALALHTRLKKPNVDRLPSDHVGASPPLSRPRESTGSPPPSH